MNPIDLCGKLGIDPAPQTFEAYVAEWSKLSEATKALAKLEMTMRRSIVKSAFPNPEEGANNFDLVTGQRLTMNHKINRSIDESLVEATRAEYELLNDRPVDFDELIKMKPTLVTSAYRKLVGSDQAFLTASRCIVAKPGAPSLEVK